jgi:soluble lytic murein transglycosylase-like protein
MGATARWLDFSGWLPDLCSPALGIKYGCKYFHTLQQRYDLKIEMIAAYNAGSARKNEEGIFVNQGYVNKVSQFYYEIGGKHV